MNPQNKNDSTMSAYTIGTANGWIEQWADYGCKLLFFTVILPKPWQFLTEEGISKVLCQIPMKALGSWAKPPSSLLASDEIENGKESSAMVAKIQSDLKDCIGRLL